MAILSVTQLNRYVGFKLKEDRALQSVLVRGEITNFTNHYLSASRSVKYRCPER